ncbi:hypothetical protein [Limosilactobacillus fermentum]|uniref:hypothetical protein n=1 Tax=Limosilactobacillus fermentum TaxID=1613 RepID=UPI0013030EF2|nr:hypothetical protein [Limosilactobacillus fermentum]
MSKLTQPNPTPTREEGLVETTGAAVDEDGSGAVGGVNGGEPRPVSSRYPA